MSAAQRLAASRAIAQLDAEPSAVLVDGNWDFVGGNTRMIVGGDATSLTISGCIDSRQGHQGQDHERRGGQLPGIRLPLEQGISVPRHKAALQALGPSTIHRRSWVFMDHIPWTGVPRYLRPEAQQTLFG